MEQSPRVILEQSDADKIIEIILIIFCSPLAVWFHDKDCNSAVCLNILLYILGVLPGIIHAIWYCFMRT